MSPNMLMFVRTAVDKIESTLKEFEKRKQLEAAAEARKKSNAPAPAIFTDKEISVKPLKGEGAKVRLFLPSDRVLTQRDAHANPL